jgi:hypothetical protein
LLDLTTSKKYEYEFKTTIQKGTFTNKLFTYPQITVLDGNLTSRNVFYEEIPDSFTGVDLIEIVNPGINYTSANVVITGDGTGATGKATVVNGRLVSVEVTNKGVNYSRAVVTIEGNGSEAECKAVLQARNGILRTYYYNTLGNKIIVDANAGTIDYDSGKVTLNSIKPISVLANDYYDTNVLTMNVVAGEEVIPPLRNRILALDADNIQSLQLEMIAEK